MDASVLSALSPEERAALLAALQEEPEKDPVEQCLEAIEYLCEELDAVKKAHDALKALVMDDMIGGIREAVEANQRAEDLAGFKGKYGAMLDPFAEKFKGKYEGKDIHEYAFDGMNKLRGQEGYLGDEPQMSGFVEFLKKELADPAAVAEVKPAEAEGEADEEPEADAQAAYDEIEAMKRRDDKRDARRKGA